MLDQNQNKNSQLSPTTQILVWTVMAANLCLLAVIWFAPEINASLPVPALDTPPVSASPAPIVAAPLPITEPVPPQQQPEPLQQQVSQSLPTQTPAAYEPPLWDSYGIINTDNRQSSPTTSYTTTQFLVGL